MVINTYEYIATHKHISGNKIIIYFFHYILYLLLFHTSTISSCAAEIFVSFHILHLYAWSRTKSCLICTIVARPSFKNFSITNPFVSESCSFSRMPYFDDALTKYADYRRSISIQHGDVFEIIYLKE